MIRLGKAQIALLFTLAPVAAQVLSHPIAADELTSGQKEIAERSLDFGFAFADLVMAAAKEQKLPPADYSGENAGKALEAMRSNYAREFAMQRSSVKLLDSSLNLAIATGVVMTGGMPAILAGSSLGYVKTKAMGLLNDEVDRNAKIFLARHLDKFTADNGMDYETLRASGDSAKIRDAIDRNGLLNSAVSSMANDPVATEILREAVVRNIQITQKSTLDQIATTNVKLEDAQEKLVKITKDLHSYTENVSRSMKNLDGRTTDLETAMKSSQKAVESLTERTASNSKDLRTIGDVLFSQSPPAQKLQLLKADFYGDMDPENKKDLITQLEGEVKKEQFVQGMQKVVGAINSVSTIAKNLSIDLGPDVDRAISVGNVASQAVTAYLSGNPLAAVAAVSSLFGAGGSDPETARHAAMMAYLKQEFEKINVKLDEIIDLQRKTMKAIEQLALSIETLQKQMHARFDVLGYEVESIQQTTRALLYDGTNHCFVLRDQWRSQAPRLKTVTIPEIEHLEAIAPLSSFDEVEKCLISLRSLFALSTTKYSELSQNPLAIRLSGAVPSASFPMPPDDKIANYRSKVQSFDQGHFGPSFSLVTQYSRADWPTTPGLLWSFAMPSRNVAALDRKVALFKDQKTYCLNDSFLNNPLINLLCPSGQDGLILRDDLPVQRVASIEDRAKIRADALLHSGMIQEPMIDLVDLALFYSAVAETQDLVNSKRIQTRKELLSATRIPQGPYLLANALKSNTVAIAQGGMLYGDLTALAIYELLLNSAANRFRSPNEIDATDSQKKLRQTAYALAKSNPYLLKNVAMLALDRAMKGGRFAGEDVAYRFALSELQRDDNGAQLNTFFNSVMPFQLAQPNACGSACPTIPTVKVVDLNAPMPTPSEFLIRKLDYPPVVEQLERSSEALANRLVAYDIAKITAKNSKVPLANQAQILSTFNGK